MPSIEQHEAAGAIGVLGHTRFKTGLAEGCRLLITNHRGDRDGTPKEAWIGVRHNA